MSAWKREAIVAGAVEQGDVRQARRPSRRSARPHVRCRPAIVLSQVFGFGPQHWARHVVIDNPVFNNGHGDMVAVSAAALVWRGVTLFDGIALGNHEHPMALAVAVSGGLALLSVFGGYATCPLLRLRRVGRHAAIVYTILLGVVAVLFRVFEGKPSLLALCVPVWIVATLLSEGTADLTDQE
jgi:hypothetical protein